MKSGANAMRRGKEPGRMCVVSNEEKTRERDLVRLSQSSSSGASQRAQERSDERDLTYNCLFHLFSSGLFLAKTFQHRKPFCLMMNLSEAKRNE